MIGYKILVDDKRQVDDKQQCWWMKVYESDEKKTDGNETDTKLLNRMITITRTQSDGTNFVPL